MPLDKQITMAFPTFIGHFQVPSAEADPINAQLKQLILEREKTTPNDPHANAGGWHSPSDLLDWPSPAIGVLQSWIVDGVNHMIRQTVEYMRSMGMPKPFQGSIRLTAWANVSRKSQFHRLHNHPGCCWSGVYYVQDGVSDFNAYPLSGVLELIDPRPFTEMVFTPGEPYGQRIPIKARPGLMIIFPSFLYHLVNPYMGETERISIAFNVKAV